ncbi:MAG: ASCH domain-containing protein [Clostridia bacterium]|nr:ASCH domain-containing protein [Clostridia bacterium]
MKVLTVKQPFASLIAEGIKEYEFRTWKTKYRGELLIHAGKGINKKAMKKFEQYHLEYPSGCIIAKVNLTDCIKIDDEARNMLNEKNPLVYSHTVNNPYWDGYGFKLEDVQKITPIPVKGKLSFWEYDYKE